MEKNIHAYNTYKRMYWATSADEVPKYAMKDKTDTQIL